MDTTQADLVRDFGVLLDKELSITKHIKKIAGSVSTTDDAHRKSDESYVVPDIAARLVLAYIINRLNYCNSVLAVAGLLKSKTAPFQGIQNTTARIVKKLGPRDNVSTVLHDLHWLLVKFRIKYKLCLTTLSTHNHRCPGYIFRLLTATASISPRSRVTFSH